MTEKALGSVPVRKLLCNSSRVSCVSELQAEGMGPVRALAPSCTVVSEGMYCQLGGSGALRVESRIETPVGFPLMHETPVQGVGLQGLLVATQLEREEGHVPAAAANLRSYRACP